ARPGAEQHARQLGQCLLVHPTLELDDRIERHPVFTPAPGIEFRMVAGAQTYVGIAPHQAQQEPDLLLPAVGVPPFPLDPVLGNVVTQPATRAAEDLHVLRTQSDLFEQFAIHGLLGRFAVLDATLRELPGVFADAFAPEYLVARVDQNDADVR